MAEDEVETVVVETANPLAAAAPAAAPPPTTADGRPLASRLRGAEKRLITKASRKEQDEETRTRAYEVEDAERRARAAAFRRLPLPTQLSRSCAASVWGCVKSVFFEAKIEDRGDPEKIRKQLGLGDHVHVSGYLLQSLEGEIRHNQMVQEALANRRRDAERDRAKAARRSIKVAPAPPAAVEEAAAPPRPRASQLDVRAEVARRLSVASAPPPDETSPAAAPAAADAAEPPPVDAYRKTVLEVTRRARELEEEEDNSEFQDDYIRLRTLRFSPIMNVNVYDNVDTLEGQEWLKKDDVDRNKRVCRALQHKFGGKRNKKWVWGDEGELAAEEGYDDVETWLAEKHPPKSKEDRKKEKAEKKRKKKEKKKKKQQQKDVDEDEDD